MNNLLELRQNLYELREERKVSPKVFSNLLSSLLYEKRFGPYVVEPVVAGLDKDNKPFLSAINLIGAPSYHEDFVVSGTATANMLGMCETLWKKDMEAEELFETLSQCLLSAVNRDSLSGWGAVVHIVMMNDVITIELKG